MSNTQLKTELKEVLSTFDKYKKGSKQYKQYANQGQKNEIKIIIEQVEETLNSKKSSPIILLNSIRIIKDCMDTKNDFFIENFYKSKILQKIYVIALFQAGNENEDRGEQYFGLEVEEEVSVIGNSLLRLVLECFMFWPIMFESDKTNKNNMISKLFDDLNQKGVQFPQNINYFKSLYKQLSQESQNANQAQSSNSNMQLTQEANKQITSEETKNEDKKGNTSQKKKKKKEVNIKALEEKINEENQQMNTQLQIIGKLLLVPTYSQLNKQGVSDAIDQLKVSQELGNTIFQVLEDVQDCINVDFLTQYIILNERTDEIIADYQLLVSSNMKFDDFSQKYGITPTSTNEIKLIQDQDPQQRKLSDKSMSQNSKQDNINLQQQQQQNLLVVEELDFEGDSPAYNQHQQQNNQNQKRSSQQQPQNNDIQQEKKQNISIQNTDNQIKYDEKNIQKNKSKEQDNLKQQPDIQQPQQKINNNDIQNDNVYQQHNQNTYQEQIKNNQNNINKQNKYNNSNELENDNQNQQQTIHNKLINTQNQQRNQVPPNSINNRSVNQNDQKNKTEEEDNEQQNDDQEYENKNMKQQTPNLKYTQSQSQKNENEVQNMKRQEQNQYRQQEQISKQQYQETNQRNILKEKTNEYNKLQVPNYQLYNDDDLKNLQTLNTEQSQINNDSMTIENKHKRQNKDQLQKSYHSQYSNSLQGSQYDQRGRSSSFKQLFEDPVHLQIMQQNSKCGSIPRARSKGDDQNTSIDNKSFSVISQEKKELQTLKEKISFYVQKLNEKEQLTKNMDVEIQMLNEKLKNFEKMQTANKVGDSNNKREIDEIRYQLQLMNDEVQARDSVLESNQKQLISLQKKYDELNYNYQELSIRCGQQEIDIEEKIEELKYLKLQDRNITENLLDDERINLLTIELDKYKILLTTKEQEINHSQLNQKQQQFQINQLKQFNLELENQISVLKQEIQVLRSRNNAQNNQESIEQIREQLEESQETIKGQELILRQKENAIQDLIFKNGQLKENQIQLEQDLEDSKTSYKKSLKQITEQKEQVAKDLMPLKQENTEMFELLNTANMEIEKLKQRIKDLEGEKNIQTQSKSSTREHLDKISMENIRVSYELKQQKEHLSQQQQQIKDLTTIIQNLKSENLMMSQQLKSGRSLMNQSNEKFFIYMTESDKNSSQKLGNIQLRPNVPLAEKVIKNIHNYTGIDKQLRKNDHQETFGYNQLQDINQGTQNTETQELWAIIENQKEQENQSQNLNLSQFQLQNTNELKKNEKVGQKLNGQIGQNINIKSPIKQSYQAEKEQKQQEINKDDKEMKKNDSQTNLVQIKDRDEFLNKKSKYKYLINQQENKSSLANNQILKERQRILVNNLINEQLELKLMQKPISNKQIAQEANDNNINDGKQNNTQQYYSYQGSNNDQNTPKAPNAKPSFVREIQTPKRRSDSKQSKTFSESKSLGYMSFNQEEYEKNKILNELNNNIAKHYQVNDPIIEQKSTIQSGQNTIYYSNNNTIEQGDTQNFPSLRYDFLNSNPIKLTPVKDSAKKQDRIEKLQSLSDYLKIQSKQKSFSPMSTGQQVIKIPYNQTADFDVTMNNESKLNTLMQDLHTLCQNDTDKIKLEDYNYDNEDNYEEESQSEIYQKENLIQQSPQLKELIHYGEEDMNKNSKSQDNKSRKLQIGQEQYQSLNQRTQVEDFQTKSSNCDDTQSQIELKQQSQLQYKQIIYPHKPDQYYNQKSIETGKLYSAQTIPYEEDLFNNLKILSNENLNRFKKSCLQNKTLLFENEYIKVGLTTHNHVYSGKNFVKLQIYIFNKDLINDIPNFNLRYLMNEDVSVWTKPEKISGQIKTHKHLKQDLIIDLNCIPFEFLTAHFQIETEGDGGKRTLNEYFLMLPTSLNRFLSFSLINANSFKSKWLTNKINCMSSEEFEYNTKIVKNSSIFSEYFPNIVELNPYRKEEHQAGLAELKIGGMFQFYHLEDQPFLIKIIIMPFNKLVIQISPSNGQSFNEDSGKCCHYLLQTLYFLFKYNALEGVNQE